MLARLFTRAWVELAVGGLIVASVALTLFEFVADGVPRWQPWLERVQQANWWLTCIFLAELGLRWIAVYNSRRFLREYWIDLIATVPSLLPDLGFARLMRLIRLLRILRLFGFLSRFSSNFPYILRRGAMEYATVVGLLVMTILLGTGALVLFEEKTQTSEAFWFSLYSLFAGEPIPERPATVGGRIVSVFVMFMGMTIFAMFTGTISAFMVERLRTKGRNVDWEHISDHVIICGWNTKAEIIIQEYQASHVSDETPIVAICQWDHEAPTVPPSMQSRVVFLHDDFTRVSALERAGIHRASTCIILADTAGGRSEQDADARTILAALTVEKLNPAVYTCAEINHREYGSHLKMGHVNDYVVSSEYSAYFLAQAAMNQGMMGLFTELLTYQHGNQFYRLQVPAAWVGRAFDDVFLEIKKSHQAILVAVYPDKGPVVVNPNDYQFQQGDDAVLIADREIRLT